MGQGYYLWGLDDGIKAAVKAVKDRLSTCPGSDQNLVLAGYSQGAMVMHQAELDLASSDPGALSHIVGTILLADGDRVANSKAQLIGRGADVPLADTRRTMAPSTVGPECGVTFLRTVTWSIRNLETS